MYFTFLAKIKRFQNVNHAPRQPGGIGPETLGGFVPILGGFVRLTLKSVQTASSQPDGDGGQPDKPGDRPADPGLFSGIMAGCLYQSFLRAFPGVLTCPHTLTHANP